MPVRLLKPGLRTSEKWNSCGWIAQSAYVRLLMMVDDAGRYLAHPRLLRSELFPFGDPRGADISTAQVETVLSELVKSGLIELYESDSKSYLQLTSWNERVRTQSKFPEPDNCKHLQTFANNCAQMLASPPTPSPSPTPSPAPASAPVASNCARASESEFAEIPSWEEFWGYCQTQACLLPAEWYVRDKFLKAESEHWKTQGNWRAYARRCKGWWESDGRPMQPKQRASETKPGQTAKPMSVWELKTVIEAKTKLAANLKARHASEGPLTTDWTPPAKRLEYAAIMAEVKQLTTKLAGATR